MTPDLEGEERGGDGGGKRNKSTSFINANA